MASGVLLVQYVFESKSTAVSAAWIIMQILTLLSVAVLTIKMDVWSKFNSGALV